MSRVLLEQFDPVTGIKSTLMEYDDKHLAVVREHLNSEALFDLNKERRNDAPTRWGDGQVVASIPLNVYYEHIVPLRQQGDTRAVKKFLNDSDNRKFRTREGTI